MARSNKVSDKINNANFEQNTTLTPAEQAINATFAGPGYYSRTSLDDVINNFIVSHVGMDKVLSKVPRHEVAFWAQRGMQEFSYDILMAEKNIEIELSPSLSIPLPSDFVNYVKVVRIDLQGNDRILHPSRRSTPKKGLLQDDSYSLLYDSDGEKTVANKSTSTERFQNPDQAGALSTDNVDLQNQDIYDYYYNGTYGRRFGNDPQFEYGNGSFQLDTEAGVIYFDSDLQTGDIIGLRYISDGISANGDLSNVLVPKMAEDALYAWCLYHLCKIRPTAAQLAPLYQKEMRAKMRNAKHRLSQYKLEEFAQVLRGRAKWIKH